MRATSIAVLAGIALFLSFTASAQIMVEKTFGRIKDRPPCLGFFVPDGAKPIPGILVSRDGGYFLLFHEEQSPGIYRGASGHFCLPPLLYHGAIGKVTQKGALKYIPVDAGQLGATDQRVASFVTMGTTTLSKLYTAIPGSAKVNTEGNLEVEYRLLPVKKEGESYRIYDFLYTRTVPKGVYPLFGRTAKDGTIVALGFIQVGKGDRGSLISVLPE
jgi:hypothetical protein